VIARDGGPAAGSGAARGLPPRPTGDADGMEALAAELGGCAGVLESVPPVRLTNWESGAARGAKAAIEAAVAVGRGSAPRLHGLAGELRREAARVRAEQARWDRQAAALAGGTP
jgi:hypothetical protein